MPVQTGPLSAIQFTTQLTVVADNGQFLPAATGRRLMGFEVMRANYNSQANILLGTQAVVFSTNLIGSFEMHSQTNLSRWYGPNGIAVDTGVAIDWVAGSFDITLYFLDTP